MAEKPVQRLRRFFAELKRRKVHKVAAIQAIVILAAAGRPARDRPCVALSCLRRI